ncbi:hypothetical protein IPC436_24370 [Pseudomonas aeruginosa]|nr:hypothetical protein IPC436_24370 [Pseudomonas aeruginosa]
MRTTTCTATGDPSCIERAAPWSRRSDPAVCRRPGAAGRMKKGAGQYRRRALLPEENLIPVRLRSLPGASTRYD